MAYQGIDRKSYIPYYIQVMDAIKEQVEQGGMPPGEQLPGEPELCRIFDVSRTVIRQALKELEIQGLIVREKGRGTFVAEPKIGGSLFQELTGFYHDMEQKGRLPVSQVLKQEVVLPTALVAAHLNLAVGQKVIQVDRLRFVEDEPIVLVTTYLPHALCPGLVTVDLANQSLYAYLEQAYGLHIARGTRTLEAVPANEYEAELLRVKKGAPLILLDSVSYLEDGTAIEYYHALHRGDRSRFEVNLIRLRETGEGKPSLTEEAIRLSTS
jgi:GntR family transcriptional regulator